VNVYELVKTFFITINVPIEEEASINLRIEILRNLSKKHKYRGRVLRLERFRLQSTYPQHKGIPKHKPSDEAIWIEDYFLWMPDEAITSSNIAGAFKVIKTTIQEKCILE